MLRLPSLLCAALALAVPAQAEYAEDRLDAAYAVCTAFLAERIEATGDAPVTFAPRAETTVQIEGELFVQFPFGAIRGADMAEAHPLTFVDKPVGACLARIGEDQFYRVVLNGEVIRSEPLPF